MNDIMIVLSSSISPTQVTLSNSNPSTAVSLPLSGSQGQTININLSFSLVNGQPNSTYNVYLNSSASRLATIYTDSFGSGSASGSIPIVLQQTTSNIPYIVIITGPGINNQFVVILNVSITVITSTPTPTPIPTPTPTPTSGSISVSSFIISNGCTNSYCWAMVTFTSSVSGTLTKVTTNYSNGSSYCWASAGGGYQVSSGSNTIWLDDVMPCNHLSCNPPGQIASLTFVINGQTYTVPVSPTVGSPLQQTPPTNSQIFVGGLC